MRVEGHDKFRPLGLQTIQPGSVHLNLNPARIPAKGLCTPMCVKGGYPRFTILNNAFNTSSFAVTPFTPFRP